VHSWCEGIYMNHATSRLKDILTGEYDLKEAREDILSLRPKKTEG